jgi:hypothetical protein
MNRWVALGVVVVGVIAAFLLFPAPDTGRSAAAPVSAPSSSPAAPPAAVRPPANLPGADVIAQQPAQAGSVRDQLSDPETPPEVRQAAAVTGAWSRLSLRLLHDPSAPASWAPLGAEARAVLDAVKAFRADPASASWPDLVARQRALVEQIRALGPDPALQEAASTVEAALRDAP